MVLYKAGVWAFLLLMDDVLFCGRLPSAPPSFRPPRSPSPPYTNLALEADAARLAFAQAVGVLPCAYAPSSPAPAALTSSPRRELAPQDGRAPGALGITSHGNSRA